MGIKYVKLPFAGTHILKSSSHTWCGLNIGYFKSMELCSNSKKICPKCFIAMDTAEKKATGTTVR